MPGAKLNQALESSEICSFKFLSFSLHLSLTNSKGHYMKRLPLLMGICILMFTFFPDSLNAQRRKKSAAATVQYPESLYSSMEYRLVGPFRGGRSAAVTGVPGEPNLFYFGATGGGVWKTTDGGRSWENISDGYFGGSIGAVEVAQSDPNVIYVGGGEKTLRGNVSSGYGIWKTVDAGKTWTSLGLSLIHISEPTRPTT